MRNWKYLLLLAALLAAMLAGSHLSGWLVKILLNLDIPIAGDTWWRYHQAIDMPRVQPYAAKIRWAGYLGYGVPLLAWLTFAVMLLKPQKQALHGAARFAKASDVAKAGLFDKKDNRGIVLGKLGNRLLRLGGQQFVILAAPTRSGKGVGVVIPNLLEYGESMVVLDIKQENFNLTSGWRASQGQAVYLFNPFAEDRRTHRWNPLSYVSQDPAFRISDIQSIAAMLYPDGADEQKFWTSQARNAFTAFALYLFERHEEALKDALPKAKTDALFPTLGRIYRLASGNGQELRPYLESLAAHPGLSPHCRTAFANLLAQADETFASIMGTFKEPLNAWLNPVLDMATSSNDFWLTEVRKRKMTIYVGIQPNKLAEARLIVNLFFSQLINVNTKQLPQDNPALKYQCLLLMDEFTSIGKVGIIASAVSYMAGYNIRLLPIIQSVSQLDATYGKEVARTLITNHALQIIYAPREQQDANDYSEMLGYTTVRKKNRSHARGRHGNVTFSESEQRRALMLPQELKAMGNDTEILLYEGLAQPVKARKIRYYQDKYFTSRLLPAVKLTPLQPPEPEEDEAMKHTALTAMTALAVAGLAACASVTDKPKAGSEAAATKQEQELDASALAAAIIEELVADMEAEEAEREAQRRAAGLPPLPKPVIKPYDPNVVSAEILAARERNGKRSAAQIKDGLFRYIDSLKRLEDAHIDNIQRQFALEIPPQESTHRRYSVYSDTLSSGEEFGISVRHPQEEGETTYGMEIYLGALEGTGVNIPCRYTLDDFWQMLLARGFEHKGWGGKKPTDLFEKYLDARTSITVTIATHDGINFGCVSHMTVRMGRDEA